jgi:hypothetical protein
VALPLASAAFERGKRRWSFTCAAAPCGANQLASAHDGTAASLFARAEKKGNAEFMLFSLST